MAISNGTILRVEKTRDYTIMGNHHLRNINLTLKAKGLLSLIFSLPHNWDYSIGGLISICNDGEHSVRSCINELEKHGYISREQERKINGQMGRISYVVFEIPQEENGLSKAFPPHGEKPLADKPHVAKPHVDNQAQLSTYLSSTKKSSTNLSISPSKMKADKTDKTDLTECRKLIKTNIEYGELLLQYPDMQSRIDLIVSVMSETICSNKPTIIIDGNTLPISEVRKRLTSLNMAHIQFVFNRLDSSTTEIKRVKSYLLTCLYNSLYEMDEHNKSVVRKNVQQHKSSQRNASYEIAELEALIHNMGVSSCKSD